MNPRCRAPLLTFFRDRRGREVDVVADRGDLLMAAEVKSGGTIADDMFDGLRAFDEVAKRAWRRQNVHPPAPRFVAASAYTRVAESGPCLETSVNWPGNDVDAR